MADKTWRAGAATSNITPPLGTSLNGGMQDRAADYVHDELHARSLVLDDGQTKLAIVVCDSCMLPQSILDEAKHLAHGHTGIPLDQMLISATHTHSAPTAAPVFQSDPDPDYCRFLAVRIADGIRRAAHNLAPAKIGWGIGSEPSQVFNRRWKMKSSVVAARSVRPARPGADESAAGQPRPGRAGRADRSRGRRAVGSQTLDGRPLALLANYSLHYVGGTRGGDVSADYYGAFAERVRQLLGGRADRSALRGHHVQRHQRQHQQHQLPPKGEVAAAVRADSHGGRSCWPAKRPASPAAIEYHALAPLAMREARLRLGRRATPKDEVARAKFVLAKAAGHPLSGRRGDLRPRDGAADRVSAVCRNDRAGAADRRPGHRGVAVRDVRRDRPGDQSGQPAQADVHDRAGQRLSRLSAHRRAARAWAATKPGAREAAIWKSTPKPRSARRFWSC